MSPATQERESVRRATIVIPAILLAALFVAAGAIPIASLWGFNHLRYFPQYGLVLYAVLLALALLPASASRLRLLFDRISRRIGNMPPVGRVLAVAGLSAVVFYILRVHVHSLGDGYQRIYQIEQGYAYFHSEPLDFFLHAVLYRALMLFGITSGELTYTTFSIVAGTAFVTTVSLFRFPRGRDSSLLKLLLIFFGGSQFFFGYVESYSLVYIFSVLYLLFAARFLVANEGLPAASVMLALAMLSHITAVIFLPSFLYLIYHSLKYCRPRQFSTTYLPTIIGVSPFVAIVAQEIWLRVTVSEYIPSVSGGILPLYSAAEYSILSQSHLFDIVNQFLLVCPAALILLVHLFVQKCRNNRTKGLKPFVYSTAFFSLLMLLVVDPKLGFARDWDLLAAPAATVGLGIVLLAVLYDGKVRWGDYTRFVLISFGVFFFSSWVLTNATTSRQLARAEELLTLSDKGLGYSTELLAHYYRFTAKDNEKALQLLQRVSGIARNPRVYSKIAKIQLELEDDKEALKSIFAGLELDSNYAELHVMAGSAFTRMDKPRLGLPHLYRALALEPERFNIHHSLGNAYYLMDSIAQAAAAFREVIRLEPGFVPAYFETGNMFRLLGQYDSAYVYVRKGLKLNPDYPKGIQLLDAIKAELTSPPVR